MVAKKGEKPFIELEKKNVKNFPLEKFESSRSIEPWVDRTKELNKLLKKTMTEEQNFHAVHVDWIERIQDLWDQLDNNYN